MNRKLFKQNDIDTILKQRQNGEFGLHSLLGQLENAVISLSYNDYKSLKEYIINEIQEFNKWQIETGIDEELILLNYEIDEYTKKSNNNKNCLITIISSVSFVIEEQFDILILLD